jgi:ubiquinone/menaquinone biosynthesis C-methylase UbiE
MVPKIFDNRLPDSLVNRLRRRRFERVCSLLQDVPRPVRILDVGGTQHFWEAIGVAGVADFAVTLANLCRTKTTYSNLKSVVVDARTMGCFRDKEFDVVFSNSVIEHLGSLSEMQRMATEMRRIGKRYVLQTPNRYFPIEPHFLFPYFQFLPFRIQVFLARRFSLGWYSRFTDKESAEREIRSIRLLSKNELKKLLPQAEVFEERIFGLTKSLTAYGFSIE